MFSRSHFVILLSVILGLSLDASSTTFKKLHSFLGNQALSPFSGLTFDNAGNAYGTTRGGGYGNGNGTVYQLSSKSGFHIIYAFHGKDGLGPMGNLTIDAEGNLYGTTYAGGGSKSCHSGCGVVFELEPPLNGGPWTETVLYSFTGGNDGSVPLSGVILDQEGNVYGTTQLGGPSNTGTVFELVPSESGWAKNVLYSFSGGDDGAQPFGSVVFDSSGNLYGTAAYGGYNGYGTVFELAPNRFDREQWMFTVIHTFVDGFTPIAGLILDAAGNLYGTTSGGGAYGLGIVFEISPVLGTWEETTLYSFDGEDGNAPGANLVFDNLGNLYGTTRIGGKDGIGNVFQLSPPAPGGQWTERSFSFPPSWKRGAYPASSISLDSAGRLYGTTTSGGEPNGGNGVIFRITP